MNGLYLGSFSDKADVAGQFCTELGDDIEIVVAAYDTPPYEGYAFVLYRQGGVLYEVNASHCSCYGLCDHWYDSETDTWVPDNSLWDPEEVVIAELVKRERYLGYEEESNPWQERIREAIRALPEAQGVAA